MPLKIEIVDKAERIQAFLPDLDKLMEGGLVTLEKVRVIAYRPMETKALGRHHSRGVHGRTP